MQSSKVSHTYQTKQGQQTHQKTDASQRIKGTLGPKVDACQERNGNRERNRCTIANGTCGSCKLIDRLHVSVCTIPIPNDTDAVDIDSCRRRCRRRRRAKHVIHKHTIAALACDLRILDRPETKPTFVAENVTLEKVTSKGVGPSHDHGNDGDDNGKGDQGPVRAADAESREEKQEFCEGKVVPTL